MKNLFVKGITFTIVILFVGTSILSNICQALEITDDFDSEIENFMKMGHIPSLVACIVKNDSVKWMKAFGKSDYYRGINSTIDTVFPIASITKSVTATAIMQIIENESYGISLDDNVSKYLPFDLKNPKYPDVNITFRMLLAHQSSFRDNHNKFVIYYRLLKNTDDWLKKFFSDPRNWFDYAPGKGVCYSMGGPTIIGMIIENITNQSYKDYCKEHIFTPLEMYNTSFYFSDFDENNLAHPYLWTGGKLLPYLQYPFIELYSIELPVGGLKSTISDFSHYLIMHTNKGVYNGVRILKESSVEEMHRYQYPEYPDGNALHGLGWYGNESYSGHSGTAIGGFAFLKIRHYDNAGVIYFINQRSLLNIIVHNLPKYYIDAKKGIEAALFEKASEL